MDSADATEPTAKDAGRKAVDDRDFGAAIKHLTDAALLDDSGDSDGLLALAYFQSQDYASAARQYQRALERQPDNGDWREQLAIAQVNAAAEVNVPVPDVHFFDRDRLLAPPEVPAGAIPAEPHPLPPPTAFTRLRRLAGNGIGAVVSVVFTAMTQVWGRLAGYRDVVWTNWYRRRLSLAMLTLGYMREQLNKHNLKSTYPAGALVGFQEPGQVPPPGVEHFRTADGTWNNLEDPMEGAAGTRFPRNVDNEAIRPESGETLMTPNPREISRRLLTREGEQKTVPFLNMVAAVWIQFQNHDWITHGDNLAREIHEVPLAEDDPARRKYRQTAMFIGKTQPDPTRRPDDQTPITYINEVTHWWDGSQIYGSDQETQDRLRSHVDGKMRLNEEDGTLPLSQKKGVEDSGMVRNWWLGLAMMHLLFVKEHNAICDLLRKAHPDWDDTRIFNVARLINAAVMAKIHTIEWTPAILPNPGLDLGLNSNWYGAFTNVLRSPEDRQTLADINVRNPEMGGVVGNPIDKHGSAFGLTEEFVEVYRLHSLLPDELEMRRIEDGDSVERLSFPVTRQAGSRKVTKRIPMDDLWFSFGNQHPGQLVLNNFPKFLQELSVPGNPLLDMGTVDILRARERGVPRYNEFRRQLGLNPIRTFSDLSEDPEIVSRLEQVYGDQPQDVEQLDLLIGTLAEEQRPSGFGFGETMFQIFILNATRRLQADRFYTDSYNADTYTPEGLAWIDDVTLKKVLLRHYPDLAETGLANVKNAFEPWDTGPELDRARHPLRGYDRALKNPWVGDAYR